MEMSQLTAFENDELLSRDLFANELGLIATELRLCELIETTLRHSHDVRTNVAILFAILSQ